jgi:RNA polymerase sigma factor (sigma-70 family)
VKKEQPRSGKPAPGGSPEAAVPAADASVTPVADAPKVANAPGSPHAVALIVHFCRLQLPAIPLSLDVCQKHLGRTYELYRGKANGEASWEKFLDNLYPLDWYLTAACLEGNARAWEYLFAVRTGRSDCLLVDALRARAARLYPGNEEKQDSAVNEFWGHLFVAERPGSLAILARYDGQRPLAPWLIRVFQNWHISQLRQLSGVQALPDGDLALTLPASADDRWREVFAQATHDWLEGLDENDVLLLGLRLRYRMSQRETAQLLGVHEGTMSRRTDNLRDRCLEFLERRLLEQGWTGDDLMALIRTEMHNLLLDDPLLSADRLAFVLGKKTKSTGTSS